MRGYVLIEGHWISGWWIVGAVWAVAFAIVCCTWWLRG